MQYLFIYLVKCSVQVAEFANVRKQLEVLEERLDEMVQPRLLDALSNRKVSISQISSSMLTLHETSLFYFEPVPAQFCFKG